MAEINLIPSPSQQDIKSEVSKHYDAIKALQAKIAAIEAEMQPHRFAISFYRKHCKHPGQQTGYNERDGSWANPCPDCFESH